MDGNDKNVTDDQTALKEMPETGGGVKANEDQSNIGEKGGSQTLQDQQEGESYESFTQKGEQSKNANEQNEEKVGEE